jgi:pimeloyl-ACP methyl ester carboxylesterase
MRHALILAGSLVAGLMCAAALMMAVSRDANEAVATGSLLLGFSVGWALLAVLSTRFTDRPERWAAVPATAMAIAGIALLAMSPGADGMTTLGWLFSPLLLALVVWMVIQVRRQPRSRARGLLLYPVFGVLAVAATGCGYESVRSATEDPAPLAKGQRLIDVGGHRLAISCTGSGSPAVVLEPGLGESAREMARLIAPMAARTTRVCVYDRAGHGRSDAAPSKNADAAHDLHELLRRAAVPAPYVIAGHSLGGPHALDYARRFPADVAGVVLIDSMNPKKTSMFEGGDSLLDVLPTLARTGLGRLLLDERDGPPVAQTEQLVRDIKAMPAELDQAAQLDGLGDLPLAVVSAGTGTQAGWSADQARLATLSSRSDHRTIPHATHASLVEEPRDAARSAAAIREVVRTVRGPQR